MKRGKMNHQGLLIRSLQFSGSRVRNIGLDFNAGLNLIYGASNTGKSLTLKAIDFMLGASKSLPAIEEIDGYDTVWLGLEVVGNETKKYSLSRSTSGGGYTLYEGLNAINGNNKKLGFLEPTHDSNNEENISTFLLKAIGLSGRLVAKNKNGEKVNFTFRDIAHIQLVNEKAIQDEISPIEGGHRTSKTKERRVFRSLLSGDDDGSIIPVVSSQKFKSLKEGKLELIEEMIADLDKAIEKNKFDKESISGLLEDVENDIQSLKERIDIAQEPVKELILQKSNITEKLMSYRTRQEQVDIHLDRFLKLEEFYNSDIDRLESIEEAGFLLSIGGERECPLCGADAESQHHAATMSEVHMMQSATLAEIDKIEKLKLDLRDSITDLRLENEGLVIEVDEIESVLNEVNNKIKKLTPDISALQNQLDDEFLRREHVMSGVGLFERRDKLIQNREQIKASKSTSNKDKPNLEISPSHLHELCGDISYVLEKWGFPGDRAVSFDEETYDIKIDGKLRTDNGKGVRAVTHAAFKVALLIYCRRKGLPHPGVLILDTPLLTYRDPINSKFGELSKDEELLASTPLKDKFFSHLGSLSDLGQFIVFENIDPPENIEDISHVHEFTGTKGVGRYGLFPK